MVSEWVNSTLLSQRSSPSFFLATFIFLANTVRSIASLRHQCHAMQTTPMVNGSKNNNYSGNGITEPTQNTYVRLNDGPNFLTVATIRRIELSSMDSCDMERTSFDRTIGVPALTDPSCQAWERCNNLIHSWITNLANTFSESIYSLEMSWMYDDES